MSRLLLSSIPLMLLGCTPTPHEGRKASVAPTPGVHITKLPDRLRVGLNGSLFTEYFFQNVPRPYCYPVIGPGELPMTRNWPLKTTPDEEHDHPHHRSLWFAHG